MDKHAPERQRADIHSFTSHKGTEGKLLSHGNHTPCYPSLVTSYASWTQHFLIFPWHFARLINTLLTVPREETDQDAVQQVFINCPETVLHVELPTCDIEKTWNILFTLWKKGTAAKLINLISLFVVSEKEK